MLRKSSIAALAAGLVLTAGGIAVAAPDSPASPSSSSAASAENSGKGGKAVLAHQLRTSVHAEWVTKSKDGTFVEHHAIKGSVVAASATSIQVKAEDGVTQTYIVNGETKIRLRGEGKGKGTAATAAQLKVGLKALVVGTGTDKLTATGIVLGA